MAELEDFSRLDRETDERVVFVGISLDDAVPDEPDAILARVTKMLGKKKIDYLNVLYLGNPAELTARWNIAEGIPQTIITDSDGEVLHTVNGRIEADPFFEKLTRLLEQTRVKGKTR